MDQTHLSTDPTLPAQRRTPTLLEQAVAKYNIPPWPYEPAFDRIIVFSIPEEKTARETVIPGGLIVAPDTTKDRQKNMSPRAILVAAGLRARDYMWDHGIDLGHVLWVARLSPWRHEVEVGKDGKDVTFMFLRVGDIVGSETLLTSSQAGDAVVIYDEERRLHRFSHRFDAKRDRLDPPSYTA